MIGVFVQTNEGSRQVPVGYIIQESGCWEWVGSRIGSGYGGAEKDGHRIQAHRLVWERERGPIPAGMTLDHLCRNKVCVRPDHLEVVDSRTNSLRGNNECAKNARKMECKNGHPFIEANTIRFGPGHRRCRTCEQAREARRHRG